jgi:hypothetical protein
MEKSTSLGDIPLDLPSLLVQELNAEVDALGQGKMDIELSDSLKRFMRAGPPQFPLETGPEILDLCEELIESMGLSVL